jgi:hypothetical protein
VAHARIALVRFRDPSQSIDIDLTLNGKLALHNSDLIKAYMTADSTGMVIDICYCGCVCMYVCICTYTQL